MLKTIKRHLPRSSRAGAIGGNGPAHSQSLACTAFAETSPISRPLSLIRVTSFRSAVEQFTAFTPISSIVTFPRLNSLKISISWCPLSSVSWLTPPFWDQTRSINPTNSSSTKRGSDTEIQKCRLNPVSGCTLDRWNLRIISWDYVSNCASSRKGIATNVELEQC